MSEMIWQPGQNMVQMNSRCFFVKLVTKNCLRNQASDTSGLSMLKCHHHLLGKADIISFIRNVFPVEPGGHGEFVVVYSESVVAVQVTVEAEQESAGERPWLALVVAEIFDLYADLLHNFAVYSFFNSLANLGKTGDHGITCVASSLIFGKDQLIAIGNANDHSRGKYRIFSVSAGRTNHFALCLIVYHWLAAAAAETTLAVPLKELISGDSGKSQILRFCCAKHSCNLKLITRKETGVKIRDQIKCSSSMEKR